MKYSVQLDDILLSLSLGIEKEEYNNPQLVRVGLCLDSKKNKDDLFNDITDCINYAPIYQKIKKLEDGAHIDLLEQLSLKIIAICFEEENVDHCRVTISKPEVYGDRALPSVTIEKSKD